MAGAAPTSTAAIRPARPEEAAALTALALRSKAHWGYDAEFMARAAPELTIAPETIAARPFFVLEQDGRVAGFYGLSGEPPVLLLDYLFVEPDHIGSGLGRRLWEHAVATARAYGAEALELESEPNAEAFYRARGAQRVGGAVSPATGRTLPYMRLRL